jgi:hypothetical protein
MKIYVFYAGMLYAEYDRKVFSRHQVSRQLSDNAEIYEGCYIHSQNQNIYQDDRFVWFRADFNHIPIEYVPKELLLLKLLLT